MNVSHDGLLEEMTPEPPRFPRHARRALGLLNVLAGLANTGFWMGLVLVGGGSNFEGSGIYFKVLFLLIDCGSAFFGLVAGIGLLLDRFWGGKALIAAVILGTVPAVYFASKGIFLFLLVIAVTAPSLTV